MFRRLDRRERRVVTAGALVSVAALLLTFVVLPQARRWSERETRIELRTDQLARLRGVLSSGPRLQEVVSTLEGRQAAVEARLLGGGTVAVAGSNLQRLLNRYASDSEMEVERVDAVAGSGDGTLLQEVPARITVRGDLRGLVDLLLRIQEGVVLLSVDELNIASAPSRQGERDLLSATIGLHGYAIGPGEAP